MVSNKENGNRNIITIPAPEFDPDPRGMGAFLHDCMSRNKDKLAQIYGPTGETDTYDALLQRTIRLAIAMKKHGVKPGDFISNCTFNHLDSGTPIIASFFIGALMAAVDPTLTLEDAVLLLKQTPPKIIFVIPESVEMIEKVIETIKSDTKIIVFGDSEKHTSFSDFLQPTPEEKTFKPVEVQNLEDTAILFFTSGTSGLPKAICLSHYAITSGFSIDNGLDFSLAFTYTCPYWNVFLNMLCYSIIRGTARLLYPKFEADNAWHPFNYKITYIFINVIHTLTTVRQGRPKDLDISSLKDILIVGAAVKLNQMLEIRQTFPETRVQVAYGLTEAPVTLLFFKPNNEKDLKFLKAKPSCTGTPLPGISCKIVNPETEEILGPKENGELRIKTKFSLSGYYNRDSSEIWDSDGFLKTGDVAYYDEDRCFYVVDRIKEMFKFQSWHVIPTLIESFLLQHPAVEIAVVIGIPHESDGDHPMGLVKLKTSHQATPEEIEKYVEERVDDRQRLRAGVKIVDGFPITATGKVSRNKVKQMVLSGEI